MSLLITRGRSRVGERPVTPESVSDFCVLGVVSTPTPSRDPHCGLSSRDRGRRTPRRGPIPQLCVELGNRELVPREMSGPRLSSVQRVLKPRGESPSPFLLSLCFDGQRGQGYRGRFLHVPVALPHTRTRTFGAAIIRTSYGTPLGGGRVGWVAGQGL